MSKAQFRSAAARLIFLVILCALAGCGWFSKNDPRSSADLFFGLLGKGKSSAAYDSASFAFQAQQSLQSFEATVQELGLTDYKSLNWTRSVIKDNEAKLDVEITTKADAKVLMEAALIKEAGRWKIYTLRTQSANDGAPAENRFSLVGRSAAFNQVFKQSLPADKQLKELVRETLGNFNAAIQQKNFDEFYKYISFAWQTQLSQKRLERAFQGFMDTGIDIGAVRNAEIVFNEPPLINGDGLLVVSGYYKVPPYHVVFSLMYTYELPKWRLYGIDVNCLK
ncbi:MAG: hypothetical protein WCH43_11870 [Verrucomicrobiota bacterium]